ncbi:MAG: hypothetical protein ACMUIE_04605, partial [Thermoplasmatota archaeon]
DPDDDNDGLDDVIEENIGTNPRLKDSDLDGVNDALDPEPLNKLIYEEDEKEGTYTYWNILVLFIILGFLVILISAMLVFRRRSTMEKEKVMRTVAMEGKIVNRYEELTGISAPLLPQVKEMGVSLPPVAAQQVAPIKRAKDLGETPNLPPRPKPDGETPQPAPSAVPEPAPAPETAQPQAQAQASTGTATCNLCGSSIDVPAGATTVECPLCGEKKSL